MQFKIPDQNGELVTVPYPSSKYTVLFFYPKDNTPGCTVEVTEFDRLLGEFEGLNAKVFGISGLSVKSKKKFEEKTGCRFQLLADENFKIAKHFGFYRKKSFMGKSHWGIVRSTVILDSQGNLIKKFENVKTKGHALEVLSFLKSL
ncbi:MAG: peroxiredoxin [Deltaproteobacteria bacterium]|nr:peroxiredoxin [Deltaproteobacteria bacterium]